jgi:uncharacterized membrane protein (UPF0127 family)
VRWVRVANPCRGTELGSRIALADSWLGRLRGMLGRPAPQAGEGLLLVPCRAVHMLGMRYPLDIAFLSADGEVLAVRPALEPGTLSAGHRKAHSTLELPAGTLAATGTLPGDRLVWSHLEALV